MNLSWVHTFNSKRLLTVSPFYQRNAANYTSSPSDIPVAASQDRSSTYAGGQASFTANFSKNNFQAGVYSFYQANNETFGAIFNDGTGRPVFTAAERPTGSLAAFFIDDSFKPFPGLTLTAGIRATHFSGNNGFSENAISPRFGAAFTIPHLHWTLRAFYGHFYQAPPLVTASGSLISLCNAGDCGLRPSPGNATRSISSVSAFHSADGRSTPTRSKPAPPTSSITT